MPVFWFLDSLLHQKEPEIFKETTNFRIRLEKVYWPESNHIYIYLYVVPW